MLAVIEITLNLFIFGAIVIAAGLTGFILKNMRLSNTRKLVERLEQEMLGSHAEILRLQKELSEKEANQSQAPIFSIRDNITTESSKDNLPDTGVRKKMLSGLGKSKL